MSLIMSPMRQTVRHITAQRPKWRKSRCLEDLKKGEEIIHFGMLIENYGSYYSPTVAYILVGLIFPISSSFSPVGGKLVGHPCVYRGSGKLKLQGECQHINHCDAALSNLWAGLNPQPCRPKDKAAIRIICCPKERRMSEKKCKEYQEVLKNPWGPIPLLPPNILREQRLGLENEIKCEPPRPDAFIVNGESAAEGEFPHMAALGYGPEKDGHWYCGGTLISENFILTAAHCVEHPILGSVARVMLGALRLSQDSNPDMKNGSVIVIDVVERFIHPEYKAPIVYNDIALLKLKEKVKIARSLRPACLPQAEQRPEKVLNTQVTGWGRTEYGGEQSDVLQKVDLARNSQQECEKLFNDSPARPLSYPEGIKRSQFCAGSTTTGKDSCQGDSGGPLTITREGKTCVYYVIGVVSFGDTCGIKPGIYTNVQSFLEWIEEVVWQGHR